MSGTRLSGIVSALLLTAACATSARAIDLQRLCGFSSASGLGTAPVLELAGAEHYGSDRAAEPFVMAVMRAEAAWRGLHDKTAADAAIAALNTWAAAGALTSIVEVGEAQSNTNSIYSLRRALIPLLVAWSSLERNAPHEEQSRVSAWLTSLYKLQDTDTGSHSGRGGPHAVSNRNNHAYMRAAIDALWAVRTQDRVLASRAADVVRRAVADMRDDGSLPLETARGARALWYQRHAIASLVFTADTLRAFNYDLFQDRPDGKSLHSTIAFLALAARNPTLVSGYASQNRNPKPGSDPESQDLGFLEPRGNGRHYMAWLETYEQAFPARAAHLHLDDLLRPSLDQDRPLIDELSGGNTSCRRFTFVKAAR